MIAQFGGEMAGADTEALAVYRKVLLTLTL
jgi:hypothetical protein